MSGYHDVAPGVCEFADADTAADLIAGNPAVIAKTAAAMTKIGNAMTLAGTSLGTIETSGWTGAASEGFRAQIAGKPPQWTEAGTGLLEMGAALDRYHSVLSSARSEAVHALDLWRAAHAATAKAIAEHNERVEHYNAVIDAGGDPGPQPEYKDPGKAGREKAEQILETARHQVLDAGNVCGRAIADWIARAPAEPGWWDRLLGNVAFATDFALTSTVDLVEGVWDGVKGFNQIARLVNPFDPYNLTHPMEYTQNLTTMTSGLLHGVKNPKQLAATVLDFETWRDSPSKALGKLLPDVALGVVTAGGGFAGRTTAKTVVSAAVDTASGGLWGLGQAGVGGVRKVGSVLARDMANVGEDLAQDASKAGRHTAQADSPSPGMQQTDSRNATTFNQPGNLGNDLHGRGNDVAAWPTSPAPEVTTSSSVPATTPPPAHTPPQHTPPPAPHRISEPSPVGQSVAPPPPHPMPPLPAHSPATPAAAERHVPDVGHRVQDGGHDFRTISDRLATSTPDAPHPHNDTPHTTEPDTPREPTPEEAPHTEPDLPEVRHVDPQTQIDVWNNAHNPDIDLRTMPDNLTWRSHDDVRPLYRVESGRDMHELFETGLPAWNNKLEHFDHYVHYNERSGYVGTTTDADLWMRHTVQDPDNMFVLEIDTRGGIDVESSRPGDYKILMKEEAEVAHPGGIAAERIKGGYYVRVDPETGERFKVPGSWVDNPNYRPYRS